MKRVLTAAPLLILISLTLSAGLITVADPVEAVSDSYQESIDAVELDQLAGLTDDGIRHLRIAEQRSGPVLKREPPQKAKEVLVEIQKRKGEPPPGHVGRRRFQNRERKLPPGVYLEYDVNPRVRGRNRGAERIVIEQETGRAYYTDDHYDTFIRMN